MKRKIEVINGQITCKKCNQIKDAIYFYCNKVTGLYVGTCKMCRYGSKISLIDEQMKALTLIKQALKYCNHCDKIKSLMEFNKGTSANGYSSHCKECIKTKNKKHHKRYHLKANYNLTLEDYNKMLIIQDNKCSICRDDFSNLPSRSVHVDHCHDSGVIRGLLCNHCNRGLSGFRDNCYFLASAITYLKSTKNSSND